MWHNISLYGTYIPCSPTVEYLSLMLDKRLTWAHHIMRTEILALNNRLSMLKTVLRNNNNIPPRASNYSYIQKST